MAWPKLSVDVKVMSNLAVEKHGKSAGFQGVKQTGLGFNL